MKGLKYSTQTGYVNELCHLGIVQLHRGTNARYLGLKTRVQGF